MIRDSNRQRLCRCTVSQPDGPLAHRRWPSGLHPRCVFSIERDGPVAAIPERPSDDVKALRIASLLLFGAAVVGLAVRARSEQWPLSTTAIYAHSLFALLAACLLVWPRVTRIGVLVVLTANVVLPAFLGWYARFATRRHGGSQPLAFVCGGWPPRRHAWNLATARFCRCGLRVPRRCACNSVAFTRTVGARRAPTVPRASRRSKAR